MNGAIWKIRKNWLVACSRVCANWTQPGRPLSFAQCRKTKASALPFATVCLRPPVDLVGIRCFVQILDAGLINERAQCAVPHFDCIAVIPFDRALDLLPVFQYKNHHGSAVNLLLKVERLCMRALAAYCSGIHPCVVGEGRRNRGHTGGISPCAQGQCWAYELAWTRRADGRQN